jgi:hypothetical protein
MRAEGPDARATLNLESLKFATVRSMSVASSCADERFELRQESEVIHSTIGPGFRVAVFIGLNRRGGDELGLAGLARRNLAA